MHRYTRHGRRAPGHRSRLITALSLLFRRRFLALTRARLDRLPPRRVALLTTITGAALGLQVIISSVGAGAIGVTVLLLLYPPLPMAIVVGSDIATRFH